MSYFIRESNNNDKNLIENFNNDLSSHGFKFKLPMPIDKQDQINEFISERKFILIEDEKKVRAGYTLKNQWFKINESIDQIGYYYNPVTAGLFNKKYNICGLLLLNDAHKKNVDLFCLGMGGYYEKLPKLLKKLNWDLEAVPFYFKIFNPNPFLENITYLKNNKYKNFIIKILKKTNLGWLIIKTFFTFLSFIFFPFKKIHNIFSERVEIFNKNFDGIWENAKKNSSFIAVRNHKYLNQLYSDKRFIKLKFMKKNEIVGWSISLCNKLENHKQFGNMNLGSIVDCLSVKGYEASIINKTEEILKKEGADLIVSNQSHAYWKNALRLNSFISGPSNFIFASSVNLTKKLGNNKKFIHLTRGDGDGPINL
jgi:hypothetical protein